MKAIFKAILLAIIIVISITPESKSDDNEYGLRYYTLREVKENYRNFARVSRRINNRVIKERGKYVTTYSEKKIEVPEKFINNFLSHLEEAREAGYYDHIFFNDLNHCHPGLPKEYFEIEYADLKPEEIREKSLSDPHLVHLYHSRELLATRIPERKNRNFLGYFDGREIKLIHPENDDHGAHTVHGEDVGYHSDPGLVVYFRAHKDGLFQLKDGTRLDIAL